MSPLSPSELDRLIKAGLVKAPVRVEEKTFHTTPGPRQGAVYRSPYICAKAVTVKEERRLKGLCVWCGEKTSIIHGPLSSRRAVYCDVHRAEYNAACRERSRNKS